MIDRHGAPLRVAVALAVAEPNDRRLALAFAGSGGDPDPGSDDEGVRLRALVELAQQGDAEAFGQLYDHYVTGVFRFIYYRVGSTQLAEDLASETFFRALRSIHSFTWQGKDFGAWLTTIARNLIADHFKARRTRTEVAVADVPDSAAADAGPEDSLLSSVSQARLMSAVNDLPPEQRDCLLMRFVQELSIAETALALGRSEGAVKQLQLRAVRRLAKSLRREDL